MEKKDVVIRSGVRPEDIGHVQAIIESSGFFYDFEVPVAVELAQVSLDEGEEQSGYQFLFAEVNGRPVAYSCFGTIAGTEHGFDLYWIATHNDLRGTGIGKILLEATHDRVREQGADFIIAETSSLEKYLPTRQFYENNNYFKEAFIRDYYKHGDGKVIYVRRFR